MEEVKKNQEKKLYILKNDKNAHNILFADFDNKDKFSQNAIGTPGGLSSKKSDRYSTPSRNSDFTSTPKRNNKFGTPSRNIDTIDTPLRKVQKTNYTPSKKTKMTPVNIAEMLNDDDFTDFMDVDLMDQKSQQTTAL